MTQQGIFNHLIEQLMALPGVGRKSAQRFAFFILKMEPEAAKNIGRAIIDVKDRLAFCKICNNITEHEICNICTSPKRDTQKVVVIEEPSTLHIIERTGEYKGLYHILLGALAPLPGAKTCAPSIENLIERLEKGGIKEVIIATNPTIEGEATAIYLTRLIQPLGITVSRIAFGIPVGIDIEYADEVSLVKSLQGRREIDPL
ncbi:MAG: recombination mediator RecR [Nitrospirota bacterium]|nr:recombination mediator RecR [Nitrospirota bacterium]NOY84900.1 recombination protein RecR [Candidatus Manganitrophaceae bacterium]